MKGSPRERCIANPSVLPICLLARARSFAGISNILLHAPFMSHHVLYYYRGEEGAPRPAVASCGASGSLLRWPDKSPRH